MIEIIYHDGTDAIPCPPGQTGGFENADGNGEVHCYPLLDGVSAMLMRLEMEAYLAHQLPDQYGAMATPVGLLVLLLFVFDWRLGLLSLVPVVLGFAIMSAMTGKRMEEKMRQYGNALAAMSNEAVEYVRGIPVVKTFGQSVFSFKKFKATIDEYEKWIVAYTKDMRMPMILYTAAINGVFAFLIAGGLLFTKSGVTPEFLLNLLFYIIITPVIALTLTKTMQMSENKMIVADALSRIDSVLNAEPVSASDEPQHPKDGSVKLSDVHFSYDGETEVIKGVSMDIKSGQTVALVGPSGGGKSTLASLMCRFFDVQSGSISVGGADVREIPKEELMDTVSLASSSNAACTLASLSGSAKAVASSRISTGAFFSIARAMAIRCCSPPERYTPFVPMTVCMPSGNFSMMSMHWAALSAAKTSSSVASGLPSFTLSRMLPIMRRLFWNTKGKTVIIIAHRLSTVVNADCIYVVRDGQIEEAGTKDGLCAKDGLFSKMWRDYQSSVEWKVAKEG